MEGLKGSTFNSVGSSMRKKRSNMPRRPRADDTTGYDSSTWCALGVSSFNRVEGEIDYKRSKNEDTALGEFDGFYENIEHGRSGTDFVRCSESALAPANWKSTNDVEETFELRKKDNPMVSERNIESLTEGNSGINSNSLGKLRKVKLKVGGVTHTIHAKSTSNGASGDGSCHSLIKSSQSMDASRSRKKLILQETSNGDSSPSNKTSGLQGILVGKKTDVFESVRKSKRVPKRPLLDEAFDDDNEDEEIRFLQRLKISKVASNYFRDCGDDGEEGTKKQIRISRVLKSRAFDDQYDEDLEHGSSKLGRYGSRNSRSKSEYNADFVDEVEPATDGELEGKKKVSLTSRQQALHSGKDISTGSGACLIEFPNGLPPAPPRKQKEKLSEIEQQLKKAEMAQRRRMQAEKAARESEAEAIRKILGQDSSRKKKEYKLKKRRDEIAQERASNSLTLSSNTVRWIMGPTGTVVIFPKDINLPHIFDSKPCSYPPPRAKCAGPSCPNTYKYRDSKTNLPLCSLQCYRAIREQMQPVSTC